MINPIFAMSMLAKQTIIQGQNSGAYDRSFHTTEGVSSLILKKVALCDALDPESLVTVAREAWKDFPNHLQVALTNGKLKWAKVSKEPAWCLELDPSNGAEVCAVQVFDIVNYTFGIEIRIPVIYDSLKEVWE